MPTEILTEILSANSRAIKRAVELLKSDEVVALPTETVYGLAGCAFSKDALKKIFRAKGRPPNDPLIVHVPHLVSNKSIEQDNSEDSSFDLVHRSVAQEHTLERGWIDHLIELEVVSSKIKNIFDPQTLNLIDATLSRCWPGPLTVVLPKHPHIPELATSGRPDVAVRCPAHPIFAEVLTELDKPLCAPSANQFGHVSPTTAQHVFDDLNSKIPLIIDGGPCEIGIESTIVMFFSEKNFATLRPGSFDVSILRGLGWSDSTTKQFAKSTRATRSQDQSTSNKRQDVLTAQREDNGSSPHSLSSPDSPHSTHSLSSPDSPHSPGDMLSHYTPNKPLVYFGDPDLNSEEVVVRLKRRLSIIGQKPIFNVMGSKDSQPGLGLVISIEPLSQKTQQIFRENFSEVKFDEIFKIKPEDWEALFAQQLFSILRNFETSDYSWLFIMSFALKSSLALALDNRLTKASWK